jgi:DNA-binding NarL/FixJ family response regulator
MSSEHRTALIADDHELFRAGLGAMLKRDLGFSEVIETGSLDEAIEHLGRHAISLACFDLSMPGVGSAGNLQAVREGFPQVRLAVITASTRREDILLALTAGAHGYVPKTLRIGEIADALRLVLAGQVFVPPCLAQPLTPATGQGRAAEKTPARTLKAAELTLRQREVLRLMAEGKSNKGIARALDLAEGTVKVHVNALFRTLGVHNRVSAVGAIAESVLTTGHYAERPNGAA